MTKIPDIICEIGLNHMGDPKYADKYMSELIKLRPYGITFMFREKEYYETRKGLTLTDGYYRKAAKRIHKAGIKLGFSVSDPEKLGFLKSIGADFFKLLSKDIDNPEVTIKLLKTGKPIYVSTGLSSEKQIKNFLKLAKKFKSPLILNHTQLTFGISDVNIKAIEVMRRKFKLPVSFGLHSESPNVLYLAVGFEPDALLFYVKGDRDIVHKDEKNAVNLSKCPEIFSNLRELPFALGSGEKVQMDSKLKSYGKK